MRKSFIWISFIMASFLLSGCAGLALTNKTNQVTDPSGENYPYDAKRDIFVDSSLPWKYQLRVEIVNSVDRASIQPNVIIDNARHPMQIAGKWNGNVSYWYYDRPVDCSTAQSSATTASEYGFTVVYTPLNGFVADPPARSGPYTPRLVKMGFGFVPSRPYPNYDQPSGMIYDQHCWETGMGCVPTWKYTVMVPAGAWPGPSTWYESKLLLSNPESQNATITQIGLGSLGSDTSSFNSFELVHSALPIIIPACGGTAEITIRYKPGFYNWPSFTKGGYSHQLILTSQVLWPGLPNTGNGPFVWIEYVVADMGQ